MKVFDLLFERMVENVKVLIVIANKLLLLPIVIVYPANYFVVEIQKHDADFPIVFMIFVYYHCLCLRGLKCRFENLVLYTFSHAKLRRSFRILNI